MKKLLSTLLILSLSISMMAQGALRETGSFTVDAGVGIGWRSNSSTTLPPLKLDAEYTVFTFGMGSLSVGAYFSLGVNKVSYDNSNYTVFLVGPMADIRFAIGENFDLFGKVILGYRSVRYSEPIYNKYLQESTAAAGVYVGGTWYFSPKVGLGIEGGYGGPTNIGIHLTFLL